MMKFEIYILQKKSQDPKMYQEAMGEYLKRLGAYAKVSVVYKKNAKQVEKILKEPGEHYHILPGRDSMTSPGLVILSLPGRTLSYPAGKRQYDKSGACTAD